MQPRLHLGFQAILLVLTVLAAAVTIVVGGMAGEWAEYVRIAMALSFGAVGLVGALWFAPADTGLRERLQHLTGRTA